MTGGYVLPPLELLAAPKAVGRTVLSNDALQANAAALEGVLGGLRRARRDHERPSPGPVVTLYELEPAPGIKSSRVIGLADDIARSMERGVGARRGGAPAAMPSASNCRTPTREKVVSARAARFSSDYVDRRAASLPLCLGKTIGGDPVIVDLARMPHLLDRRHHRVRQVGGRERDDLERCSITAAAGDSAG